MNEMNKELNRIEKLKTKHSTAGIHPAWLALIRHCREVGFGEIERVKIQDGIPVMIEKTIKRTKLT
jgi:hypothetical protein